MSTVHEAPPRPGAPGHAGSYLPAVDFARFLSILSVLGIHYLNYHFAPFPRHNWVTRFCENGAFGVTFFFVISGFVITRRILIGSPDLTRLSLKSFYIQRAARILPLLFWIIAIGTYFTWIHTATGPASIVFLGDQPQAIPWVFLSILTFTYNWFLVVHGNVGGSFWQVLWSLAVEEQFYLFYPFLLKKCGNRQAAVKLLLCLLWIGPLFRIAVAIWDREAYYLSYCGTFSAVDSLALGALAALFLDSQPHPSEGMVRQIRVLGMLGALMVMVVYLRSVFLNAYSRTFATFLLSLGASLFLAASPFLSLFDRPPLRTLAHLGKYSYGGYLYHLTLLFAFWAVLTRMPAMVGFAVVSAATFLVAGLSYEIFERPVNRWIRQRFGVSPSVLG